MWLSTTVRVGCIYKLEVVSASVMTTASSSVDSFQLPPLIPHRPVLEPLMMTAKVANMPREMTKLESQYLLYLGRISGTWFLQGNPLKDEEG